MARIRAAGLLMQAEMLVWERTGDFAARGCADHHRICMEGLIAGRSLDAVQRMEDERGLHG